MKDYDYEHILHYTRIEAAQHWPGLLASANTLWVGSARVLPAQLESTPLGISFSYLTPKQRVGSVEEKLYDAAIYRSIIGNNRRRGRGVSQSND